MCFVFFLCNWKIPGFISFYKKKCVTPRFIIASRNRKKPPFLEKLASKFFLGSSFLKHTSFMLHCIVCFSLYWSTSHFFSIYKFVISSLFFFSRISLLFGRAKLMKVFFKPLKSAFSAVFFSLLSFCICSCLTVDVKIHPF